MGLSWVRWPEGGGGKLDCLCCRVRRREVEVAEEGGSLEEEVTEWGWLVHGLVSSANPCEASEAAVDAGRV